MTDLIFFCSPIGLGHATRDAAIANYFENVSTKFISGSGAAKFFKDFGFDVIDKYVPPKFDVQNGLLRSHLKWLWNYYRYYKDCKKISAGIIEKEKPDLVISDEDFASLSIAQEKNLSTILITDILETRFTKGFGSLIEKKMNKSMNDIIKKCDAVILPENGLDDGNIRRVGPIVRETIYSRDELRRKFSFDKNTVVLTIGGTDAGKFLIERALESVSKLSDKPDIVIVAGPSTKITSRENVRNLGFVNNLHELIFAADLVISLAGKSTIDEAKAYGTPGIFIPIKDHFEQEDNAKGEGFCYEDIFRLDSLIKERKVQGRTPVKCNGAKRAYEIIKRFLD